MAFRRSVTVFAAVVAVACLASVVLASAESQDLAPVQGAPHRGSAVRFRAHVVANAALAKHRKTAGKKDIFGTLTAAVQQFLSNIKFGLQKSTVRAPAAPNLPAAGPLNQQKPTKTAATASLDSVDNSTTSARATVNRAKVAAAGSTVVKQGWLELTLEAVKRLAATKRGESLKPVFDTSDADKKALQEYLDQIRTAVTGAAQQVFNAITSLFRFSETRTDTAAAAAAEETATAKDTGATACYWQITPLRFPTTQTGEDLETIDGWTHKQNGWKLNGPGAFFNCYEERWGGCWADSLENTYSGAGGQHGVSVGLYCVNTTGGQFIQAAIPDQCKGTVRVGGAMRGHTEAWATHKGLCSGNYYAAGTQSAALIVQQGLPVDLTNAAGATSGRIVLFARDSSSARGNVVTTHTSISATLSGTVGKGTEGGGPTSAAELGIAVTVGYTKDEQNNDGTAGPCRNDVNVVAPATMQIDKSTPEGHQVVYAALISNGKCELNADGRSREWAASRMDGVGVWVAVSATAECPMSSNGRNLIWNDIYGTSSGRADVQAVFDGFRGTLGPAFSGVAATTSPYQ